LERALTENKSEDITRQPEQIRAFRDTWQMGIHSYLAYLRDRLLVARELLTDSGSIFIQIGDENVHLIRCLLDEIFGSENFISQISFQKTGGLVSEFVVNTVDYILWYGKVKSNTKWRPLYADRETGSKSLERYDQVVRPDGHVRHIKAQDFISGQLRQDLKRFQLTSLESENPVTDFEFRGKIYKQRWKTNPAGRRRLSRSGRIVEAGSTLRYMRYLADFAVIPITDRWESMQIGTTLLYVVQTSTSVVQRCLLMSTDPGDLVLDPTCGSGTTAYVAEQWGRRWITMDTSRVSLALARTRLMAARYPYYLLIDSPEGAIKEAEITRTLPKEPQRKAEYDVKKGFVYERVPHIKLKSIANNEKIDTIYSHWEVGMVSILAQLNAALNESWQEWEVPRDPDKNWPEKAKKVLTSWWESWTERQKEIDEAIAKAADQEILYDQPYEDNKTVRVTGPFTVESLSPHRVLSTDEDLPSSESEARTESSGQFETMIIENLNKAGVQNTVKNERLKFDRLEPYAGKWLHAEGEYTENDKSRRVAVCIGPEHGTVGPDLIKEAAKEAVQGIGFDLLIVCGFAFDPHVSEEVKRYGKLTILPARMNADLAMGDELLKKTGSGNLFMVFGEPDLKVDTAKDGLLTVELKGLDIYNPTTGEIRANSTDDIACWFIDTNYNGESFFVRHAYFTGADRPYEKLSKALKAEINEDAWEQLYRTKSRPFKKPDTGKIAVKVINHYGDEVLRVYPV